MKNNRTPIFQQQTGFSLIELMVGLAIGLLASLVIMQVMSVFEGQKRVTTGTADAQVNGNIALYEIGRELKMAGYPLMPAKDSALECTSLTLQGVANNPNLLSPVVITDGNLNSDTISIRYGNGAGGIPSPIGAVAGNTITLGTNLGCLVGDSTLITNGANCAISTATEVPANGSVGSAVQQSITLQNANAAAIGANLSCMGAWNTSIYSVNNFNLDLNGAPIIAGIVGIQAQYGISDTTNNNRITQWVDATGIWQDTVITTTNRNRIKAVRLAIIARTDKLEQSPITAVCSSNTTANPTGLCAWDATSANPVNASPAPTFDLAVDDVNWARYRYRVFETIIPLRNMIWSKDTL